LFLGAAPREALPLPDMRVLPDETLRQPSACLLETVYACQLQQDWYRDDLLAEGHGSLPFVGSAHLGDAPGEVATEIASVGVDYEGCPLAGGWTSALRLLTEGAEAAGVVVMMRGADTSLPHAWPRPQELSGFVLADDRAPLVFVNTAATGSAQVLALAHGLARVWLGGSAVSNVCEGVAAATASEAWCRAVANALTAPFREVASEQAWTDTVPEPHTHVSRALMDAVRVAAWEGRTSFPEARRLLGGAPLRAAP
jgi:hypothetical protein